MNMIKDWFPLRVYIHRNEYFFANVQWLLFKWFGKKRTISCGRTKKDKHLCCCQPLVEDRVYFNEDRTQVYCKCCDSIRLWTTKPIKLNDRWWEEEW